MLGVTGVDTAKAEEVFGDFGYISNSEYITITSYKGNSTDIVFPATIDGLPVEVIGGNPFNSVVMVNEVKESTKYPFDFEVKLELPNPSAGGADDKIETAHTGNGYNWLWLLLLVPLLYLILCRKKYVLYDNAGEFPSLIYKDDEDYDKLVEYKKSNDKEYAYLHLYTKHKFKDENKGISYCYKYRKSIFNDITNVVEDDVSKNH